MNKVCSLSKFIIVSTILLLFSLGVFFSVIFVPYGNVELENSLTICGIICFIINVIYFVILLDMNRKNRNIFNIFIGVAIFFLNIVLITFLSSRISTVNQLSLVLDGRVTKVFNSPNHKLASIEVMNSNSDCIKIEGISHDTWILIKKGDSLKKKQWASWGYLNGKYVNIIPAGIFDKIRAVRNHRLKSEDKD